MHLQMAKNFTVAIIFLDGGGWGSGSGSALLCFNMFGLINVGSHCRVNLANGLPFCFHLYTGRQLKFRTGSLL